MAISPISTPGPLSPGSTVTPPTAGAGVFARILGEYVHSVGGQQATAQAAVQGIAAGRTDNLHNVILEVSRADLAFRLFLEIRNRLSDAYQEIMKMSV